MLGAGGLGIALAALAGIALKNRGVGADVVTGAVPAACAGISAMANNQDLSEHCKTCHSNSDVMIMKDIESKYDETMKNVYEDRLTQAGQFNAMTIELYNDRLQQANQFATIQAQIAQLAADQACCCKTNAMRDEYLQKINELERQIDTNAILCRLPQTTPINLYPPLCNNTCGCSSCS